MVDSNTLLRSNQNVPAPVSERAAGGKRERRGRAVVFAVTSASSCGIKLPEQLHNKTAQKREGGREGGVDRMFGGAGTYKSVN